MAPYSMDLRQRVARAWDAGEDAETIAETYAVSRAWVHRLIQRRRETGSLAPRKQTVFKKPALAGQEDRLRALVVARPDQTLAELRDALPSSASLSSVWRALDRLDITIKKNGTRGRTTPAGRRR
jgi:transposase